ncbi:MAG TPA: aminotransferase class V-fold PLP-dependent enzyme [Gemmatimonadaceae bacterium]|nr:aminotransferase class V-fold PLP-dependent enzyme [Gemmatimonadaceae bacterium]
MNISTTAGLKQLLSDTLERSHQYLGSLPTRPVAPRPDGVAGLAALDVPLQQNPIDATEVIRELDEIVTPATMAMAGPRFFGFVIGGTLPAALAAHWLSSTWDQNTGLYNSTPGTSHLEQVALKWMLELLDLPRESAGAFVTGTTVAHITALAAARHAVLARAGWDVEADGLFGAPEVTVITSAEAHPTLFKALGVIGFGRKRVVKVPVDDQGRMRADAMPAISGPTIVCVQVGNVNSGACDDVGTIGTAARAAGAWVHVDGAFGLWARVAPTRAHLVKGMENADSWATDAHKWLNVPYDSGVAFVRDGDALRKSMAVSAEYLPTETAFRNPSDFTPELSRRGRGVDIWAALRSLGRAGVSEMIEANCRQARRFGEGLTKAGFRVLNDVVLNQVVVQFGDADRTRQVIRAIQEDGTMWAGETVWQGQVAMRISVSCWATTDEDVEKSLAAIVRLAS